MLNLIVAVVLETFAEQDKAEEMKLNQTQIEQFVEAWKELDPDATHFAPTKKLKELLLLLDEPLGFKNAANRSPAAVTTRLKALEVPDRAGMVAFHDVLESLGKIAFGTEEQIELPPGTEGNRAIQKQYGEVFKSTGLHKTVVSQYSSAYIFAVIRMQNAFRRRLAKRRNGTASPPPPKKGAAGNAFTAAARQKSQQQMASSSRSVNKPGSKGVRR